MPDQDRFPTPAQVDATLRLDFLEPGARLVRDHINKLFKSPGPKYGFSPYEPLQGFKGPDGVSISWSLLKAIYDIVIRELEQSSWRGVLSDTQFDGAWFTIEPIEPKADWERMR